MEAWILRRKGRQGCRADGVCRVVAARFPLPLFALHRLQRAARRRGARLQSTSRLVMA